MISCSLTSRVSARLLPTPAECASNCATPGRRRRFRPLRNPLAVQFEFVVLLQAGLADMVGALVVGFLLPLTDPLQVAVGDAADVAQGVGGRGAQGVLAEQPGLDLDAGEAVAVAANAATSSSVSRVRMGDRLKILGFVERRLKRLRSLGWMSMISPSWLIAASRSLTREGVISRVKAE